MCVKGWGWGTTLSLKDFEGGMDIQGYHVVHIGKQIRTDFSKDGQVYL